MRPTPIWRSGSPGWPEHVAALVYNNVVHRHFLWFKAMITTRDSALPHQYGVPGIGTTALQSSQQLISVARVAGG